MTQSTLRIIRIQHDLLEPGPLPTPFHDATMGPFTHWKLPWLRITTDDGLVGQASAPVPSPEVVAALLDDGPCTIDQWWQRVWWMLRNQGHRCGATSNLVAGCDMALRDICAQRASQPLHRFLGATRDRVPVYASGGGTNLSIEQLVQQMTGYVAQGYRTLKMKVGSNFGTQIERDVQRVQAVREAVGPSIELAIDANQTWTADQALAFARQVESCRLAWFEEPVHSADREAIAQISRQSPIPVAMGESENHWLGFRDLAQCRVPHLQPSPHALPGFARWREALQHARVSCSSTWSAGGLSHLTAMFVAAQPDGMVEFLESIIGHLATCWSSKPTVRDGMFHLPTDRAGLPVEVDWQGLQSRGAVVSQLDARA